MRLRGMLFAAAMLLVASALVFVAMPQPALAQTEIHLGSTMAESGPFAPDVGPFRRLFDAWVADVNGRGGLMVKSAGKKLPLRFTMYDDKSDQKTAVKFYEKLITDDKVDFVLGPFSSPITFAASTVAEKHKVPMPLGCANDPRIFARNYEYIFATLETALKWADPYLDMIKEEGKAKTIAFVTMDILNSKGITQGAVPAAKDRGLTVVAEELAPPATTDFSPIIAKLKALNPDIVWVSSFGAFASAFIKQAKELNLNPREFHVTHPTAGFYKSLGKDANYVTGDVIWTDVMTFPGQDYFKRLLKAAKIDPVEYPWAACHMWMFQMAEYAIEKAGSLDREAIKNALAKADFMTVSGPVKVRDLDFRGFKMHNIGSVPMFPMQFIDAVNNKVHLLMPKEFRTGPHLYPTAPWSDRK
ncbi:MAG: amino acid ABC transporter substrate-binding protein [Candidatus Tectomicrobia bacterium]|nr:amino acid ABC transporter substrate-binding protein [Candidatus Tectomicrobia bacterium]